MSNDDVELVSRMDLDRCCRLMATQIDSQWAWSRGRPLIGRMKGTWLRVRRRISYRNSFQTCLTANLSAQGQGTLVRCTFAMDPFVRAFVVVWFTLVVLIGGAVMLASVLSLASGETPRPKGQWLGLVQPLIMLGFGVALVRFGRYLARDERELLLTLVSDTLLAERRAGSTLAEERQ